VLGPTAIVGATARSLDEALAAQAEGAAYVGVGSLYASRTKEAPLMTPATAGEIARSLRVPVVAIGGIDEVGAAKLSGMGLAGVAVCRALFEDRNEVTAAARRIRDAFLGAAAK
jgi:thiamine-phosphate diphosphorylase